MDIRAVNNITDLIGYFSSKLGWNVDIEDFEDIDDISYDFSAEDIGLKEESFARISSLKQLQPLVDNQQWGIFCIEFNSSKFEVSALRKILSGLVPRRRNSADHAVWEQQDLLFICNWGESDNKTIGVAHFEDKDHGLPQIKMISCAPSVEDFTQIRNFENNLAKLAWPKNTSNIDEWRRNWSSAFSVGYHQVIRDSSTLTMQLAAEAQNIRNHILEIMDIETENGYVHQIFRNFSNTLIHDLTIKQFADMYAQTIVYGLFSARCMTNSELFSNYRDAINAIPNTNPFLKGILGGDLVYGKNSLAFDELEIENVIELLKHARTDLIIQDFNRQTGGGKEDPVIHFYEDFLTAYDKDQKVQRGVFYTPQPIVNFMVNAVDSLLKEDFKLEDGLASIERIKKRIIRNNKKTYEDINVVQILDPALGTGTFLRQVILKIYDNFKSAHKELDDKKLDIAWSDYVKCNLLGNINGFELMMAPYAVAHMKLAMVLKDTGYDFNSNSRLKVFLTNSLETPGKSDDELTLFDDPLALESVGANGVKKNSNINIVIGNPPYSGESANKGSWIMSLMETYKKEPGSDIKLQERNPKWINDDYVKFIRYAQEIIHKSGSGIIAYITPHGYISNPTFRGMRWSLLNEFHEIYVIDLHGNSNRNEISPDGSKDENVFDIQQGVCISFFVKRDIKKSSCKVFHADIYGSREYKYNFLNSNELADIEFTEVYPTSPDYLFIKINNEKKDEYVKGISLNNLFKVSSTGIVTARDKLNLDFSKDILEKRLTNFMNLPVETAREVYNLKKDVDDWKVSWAQKDIQDFMRDKINMRDYMIPIMYRIFDVRYMLYTGCSRGLVCRPRCEVTEQFILGDNLGLVTGRTNKSPTCDHYFAVNMMVEVKCGERTTGSIIYPLYLYTKIGSEVRKEVNLDIKLCKKLASSIGVDYNPLNQSDYIHTINEKDIFYYIYAILYSVKYRDKYSEFLKMDFSNIPICTNKEKFKELVALGCELVEIHTMQNKKINNEIAYVGVDQPSVNTVSYKSGRIYINKTDYFDGVEKDDWEFIIGGYQVLKRWFKDRKGSCMSKQDVSCYCYVISVIKQTQIIMDKIDSIVQF